MRLRGLPGLFLIVSILLFVVPSAATFYTDWLWFVELGYEGVFLRTLNAQALVFVVDVRPGLRVPLLQSPVRATADVRAAAGRAGHRR